MVRREAAPPQELARSRVLQPTTLARRNRAWEARELFTLVDFMERSIAQHTLRNPL